MESQSPELVWSFKRKWGNVGLKKFEKTDESHVLGGSIDDGINDRQLGGSREFAPEAIPVVDGLRRAIR